MDVTEEILRQHHEQRLLFLGLHELRGRSDGSAAAALWDHLARLLEVHAAAEEEHFYPLLLRIRGEAARDETEDAIKDHDEIRDAVAVVRTRDAGTPDWWEAISAVERANSDHMAEEERDDLADVRRFADQETRHRSAVGLLAMESRHDSGIEAVDKDPRQYVESHLGGRPRSEPPA